MSHTLYASGVYMGDQLNASGDLLPPEDMYEACRILAPFVEWRGDLKWDFRRLGKCRIPAEFVRRIQSYLRSVLESRNTCKGWKIPETTLAYPWIARLFPDTKYIFWIRDPRDCVMGSHLTDDLGRFGIEYPVSEDLRRRRAISWKYQYDLVKATPRPAHWIEVRFEDFVLRQEETLTRLEDFLGIPLARIVVRPNAVGRWEKDKDGNCFDFFAPAMKEYGYGIQTARKARKRKLKC